MYSPFARNDVRKRHSIKAGEAARAVDRVGAGLETPAVCLTECPSWPASYDSETSGRPGRRSPAASYAWRPPVGPVARSGDLATARSLPPVISGSHFRPVPKHAPLVHPTLTGPPPLTQG